MSSDNEYFEDLSPTCSQITPEMVAKLCVFIPELVPNTCFETCTNHPRVQELQSKLVKCSELGKEILAKHQELFSKCKALNNQQFMLNEEIGSLKSQNKNILSLLQKERKSVEKLTIERENMEFEIKPSRERIVPPPDLDSLKAANDKLQNVKTMALIKLTEAITTIDELKQEIKSAESQIQVHKEREKEHLCRIEDLTLQLKTSKPQNDLNLIENLTKTNANLMQQIEKQIINASPDYDQNISTMTNHWKNIMDCDPIIQSKKLKKYFDMKELTEKSNRMLNDIKNNILSDNESLWPIRKLLASILTDLATLKICCNEISLAYVETIKQKEQDSIKKIDK